MRDEGERGRDVYDGGREGGKDVAASVRWGNWICVVRSSSGWNLHEKLLHGMAWAGMGLSHLRANICI